MRIDNAAIERIVSNIFRVARVPGGAVAVVAGGKAVFAKGYGTRDRELSEPLSPSTLFPIASTTKAMNATLLGMLVDDGHLRWDDPIVDHLPGFRFSDPVRTPLVTIRDCLAMRTGMPRHDWVWLENLGERDDLVERFAQLELSAGIRERFQYNNLLVTLTGIIAERVMHRSWEALVQERLLDHIGMKDTVFGRPVQGDVTSSWHERSDRTLVPSEPLATARITAPSGGSIHSTVLDMARWVAFNLNGGSVAGHPLIRLETLEEIHAPQMVTGKDPPATSPTAAYGLGWFIDHFHGRKRITHGGYLDDVATDIALFPEEGLGIVCFANFGPPPSVKSITAEIFESVCGMPSLSPHAVKLAEYEQKIADTKIRNDSADRVLGTRPSHPIADYCGRYVHPGYGVVEIHFNDNELGLHIGRLIVPLKHWHYDAWVAAANDRFAIHMPHCFDPCSRFAFETDVRGSISALSVPFEATVQPIRFARLGETPTHV